MLRRKPLVGIPASVRLLEHAMEFHGTANQYLRAVREDVGATVFTIPGLPDTGNAIELLDSVDGVLLTGSFSNMHPSTYGEPIATAEGFYDQKRDAVTLPLIRAALERSVPIFCICRGMQELNVALGGSCIKRCIKHPARPITGRMRTCRSKRSSGRRTKSKSFPAECSIRSSASGG